MIKKEKYDKIFLEKFTPYNEQEEVERKIMLNYISDFKDVLSTTSEVWIRDRIYAKIIDKMKKDGIILINRRISKW